MIYLWSEAGVKLTSEGGIVLTLETAFDTECGGVFVMLIAITEDAGGRHRSANDALALYELYKGQDADPDMTSPWETFATLPHTTAALALPPAGNRTYKFVLRLRDAWNLDSQNPYSDDDADIASWAVTINSAGAVVATPPSAPSDILLEQSAAGAVHLTAAYNYTADGSDAADAWLIYLRSNGTDPDPALDTPTEVAMVKRDAQAHLDWTSGVYADGADVRVILRTRRNGTPDVDSTNVDVQQVFADTDGPSAPAGGIFYGKTAEAHHITE
jgi:hypothetical protein